MRNNRFRRAYNHKPAKPFTGMVRQLEKETIVLCTLDKFEGFKQALVDNDIEYDLGDFFDNGIIVMKK